MWYILLWIFYFDDFLIEKKQEKTDYKIILHAEKTIVEDKFLTLKWFGFHIIVEEHMKKFVGVHRFYLENNSKWKFMYWMQFVYVVLGVCAKKHSKVLITVQIDQVV